MHQSASPVIRELGGREGREGSEGGGKGVSVVSRGTQLRRVRGRITAVGKRWYANRGSSGDGHPAPPSLPCRVIRWVATREIRNGLGTFRHFLFPHKLFPVLLKGINLVLMSVFKFMKQKNV